MNYIKLINNFWNLHEVKSFRATEISLYFYLLKVCNSVAWSASFELKNQRILVDLCMSYHTMCNARNKLKQSGLIEFETKNGSNKTVYSIVTTFANFAKVGETSAETSANFAKVGETSAETSAETFANFAKVVSISNNNNIYNNKTKTKTVVVEEKEKEKEETAAAAVSFQIKKIIEFWNTRCNNMPAVAGVTPARAREIENLLRVYTIDEICDCLFIASQSPTLNGERNERPVKIDWCLKNFLSLYEDRITINAQKQRAAEEQEKEILAAKRIEQQREQAARERAAEEERHRAAVVQMPDYILEHFPRLRNKIK